MRQRTTFIYRPDDPFEREQLEIRQSSLKVKRLKAAREDRLSLDIHEILPAEVWRALKQSREVHIRWVSTDNYPTSIPFVSRLPPGLHVSFISKDNETTTELLCPLLQKTFGEELKCTQTNETFVDVPLVSPRFAESSFSQFYHVLPSLSRLISYIQQNPCQGFSNDCVEQAEILRTASYVDIDYDAPTHVFKVSVYRASPPGDGWTEEMYKSGITDRLEVGVLAYEKAVSPEELSLGGFLTIVGDDDEPKPTLFSFPSRHHPLRNANYDVSFDQPTGLHPTLRISFPPLIKPEETCTLHTYLTLPSYLFADKYQFADKVFLASKNLEALKSITGEIDLEAPDWVIDKWGSSILLQLAPPDTRTSSWDVEIPLHLRYLPPSSGGLSHVIVPWPVVFWACEADEGIKMKDNPFDRANVGYDGLFKSNTMFYHLNPNSAKSPTLMEKLQVPVLDSKRIGPVEIGTVLAILLGFLFICWKLFKPVRAGKVSEKKTQ